MTLKKIQIASTTLEVSRFCLGMGDFGNGVRGDDADRLTAAYLEAGGNFFDTAHCYAFWIPNGLGASEKETGACLRRLGATDKAIIATKGGHSAVLPDYPRPDDFLSDKMLRADIEESLNRLQTDAIDLYYLHRDDGKTPVGEIIEFLNAEIEKGRLRYLGASNWSVARMAEANAYAAAKGLQGFVVSQIQWSLSIPDWKMDATDPTMRYVTEEEIKWHTETKIPIAAYSATGTGFFAKDAPAANPVNQERRERARTLSAELNCTPTQVALAWLLHQEPTVLPVFSTSKLDHLNEVLYADSIALMPEQMS